MRVGIVQVIGIFVFGVMAGAAALTVFLLLVRKTFLAASAWESTEGGHHGSKQ
jgi:hypothetical protein